MKTLLVFLMLISSARSSIIYIPVDYPSLYRDADLIAIAVVANTKDSGSTKELIRASSEPSRLAFREFKTTYKIVSILKGKAGDSVICTLYRYPTVEEAMKHYGGEDGRSRLGRCLKSGGEVHVFSKAPSEGATYLVYLRSTPDGSFIPVTGDSAATRSIFRLP